MLFSGMSPEHNWYIVNFFVQRLGYVKVPLFAAVELVSSAKINWFPNSALFIVDFFFTFKRPKIADMGRRGDQLFICLYRNVQKIDMSHFVCTNSSKL